MIEEYVVSFSEQKSDGLYEYGKTATVLIDAGVSEKANHEKVRELFLKRNPKARVVSVTYV